ncbi:hypothetical protein F4815DRAFT_499072 [Daldinia loculata]|nr:hypothetical protein F4815DRAFT_499072 [Daldinia loculata]
MMLSPGGIQVMIVGVVMNVFAIIAVGLRLWSRRIQGLSLEFNDYMAIIAVILTTGLVICCLFGAIGVHVDEILFIPGQILWAASNTCVKLSILSLYTVLFPRKIFSRICYCTMGLAVVYLISVLVETFALCTPVQHNWDKSIPGKCTNQHGAYLGSGITNLIIDVFIVTLPMPMLFRLQMSWPKKLSIAVMFSLGAIICVLSLLRIISVLAWNLSDITYSNVRLGIYSELEPTLGVVNACLPTIKPALRFISRTSKCRINKNSSESNNSKPTSRQEGKRVPISDSTHDGDFERLGDSIEINLGNANSIMVVQEWEVERSYETVRV